MTGKREWLSGYNYVQNNPILRIDPDGAFDTKSEAKGYAEDNNIRTGWFSRNKIEKSDDGSYAINNKKEHTSTSNDRQFGVTTGALVTAERNGGNTNNDGGMLKTASDVFSAAGISLSTKTKLMDYAVRDLAGMTKKSFDKLGDFAKSSREMEALGKAGTKYLRYSKNLGALGNVVGVTSAGLQFIDKPTIGNATRLGVQGLAIGANFIPVVGPAISIGIGTADMIWGDQFYNSIDKK